jgi:hypothetical protein
VSYISADELRAFVGAVSSTIEPMLADACVSASAEVNTYCGRTFVGDSVATARKFRVVAPTYVVVDDCYDLDSVATDTNDSGTFDVVWSANDYEAEPLNGVSAGTSGWPITTLRAVSTLYFPANSNRATVQVEGKWGWADVPAPVRQATLLLAAETLKSREAPFGVAGIDAMGAVVRVRQNALVAAKLNPFRRSATAVPVA